jgi:hypothetical protein
MILIQPSDVNEIEGANDSHLQVGGGKSAHRA